MEPTTRVHVRVGLCGSDPQRGQSRRWVRASFAKSAWKSFPSRGNSLCKALTWWWGTWSWLVGPVSKVGLHFRSEKWPQLSSAMSLFSSDYLILRNRNSSKEIKVSSNFYCQDTEGTWGIQCNSRPSWAWNVVSHCFLHLTLWSLLLHTCSILPSAEPHLPLRFQVLLLITFHLPRTLVLSHPASNTL